MKKIDMSEKAILRRFNQTEQLRELSLFLMKAKKMQDESINKIQKKSESLEKDFDENKSIESQNSLHTN